MQRNTEPNWDFFAVEARPTGTDSWTTLPDLNGHTTQDTGFGCPSWFDYHPFLTHYQSDDGEGGCEPSGTTGAWNAVSGPSDGYETWSVDLSKYAGQQVEVSLSVITDSSFSYAGAWVDDIVGPGGVGSTSFEPDGNTMDGWTVPGAPAGSPGNDPDWTVAASDTRPSIGDRARTALDEQPEILAFLSSVLGPYPFKQAGGIVDDDPSLGFALENQTRPIYSKDFFQVDGEDNDSVVTHELTHQWTGDDLALGRWQDIWLNEGFATYLEWLWSEHKDRATAQQYFDFYASFPADDSLWSLTIGDPGPDNLFDNAVYTRGAMTLHALRQQIGDTKFFRLVKQWTAKYAGGNVTTPQFIALAEQVSGQQLDAFFDTWLYTPSKPSTLPEAALKRSKASASARCSRHRNARRRQPPSRDADRFAHHPSAVPHGDEDEGLVAAGHVLLADDADPGGVELEREHRLLEPSPLEAAHQVVELSVGHGGGGVALHDPGLVLGVAAVVLLSVRLGGAGMRGHDHARDSAVDTGLPGSLPALEAAVLVVRRCRLAEVPDVALVIGCVPVAGLLRQAAIRPAKDVAHHDGGDTLDPLRPMRDEDALAVGVTVLRPAISGHGPRLEREVPVRLGVVELVRGNARSRRGRRGGAGRRGRPGDPRQGCDHSSEGDDRWWASWRAPSWAFSESARSLLKPR